MTNLIKKYFEESKYFSMKLEKYFQVYDSILSKYKFKEDLTVVEIGVKDGGSLFMWQKLFPNAKIIGIDLNIECKKFEKDGFFIEIGDQSSKKFWKNFFYKHQNVDIIIDDGGHTNIQQIITAISCIPFIKDGGILITEDVMCSYFYNFGNPSKYSFINFCKKIIDDINFKYPGIGKFKFSLNDYVHSIEFFESIVVFKIDRKLCGFNKVITNNKKNFNHEDLRYGFKKKIFKNTKIESIKNFLKKFKILNKINHFFFITKIRRFNNVNSSKMKKYFK
ncbi:hypothetical protein OAT35_01210 [Candidatus Pelagibacter sp.]|nr:hypothetical protein [Candidatus Pelagibacter sp.]